MMPVFIDENIPGAKPGDTLALLDAIGSFLKQVIREEAAPTNELIKKLLERRRILLIVDGYSELNNDTQQVIRPSAPALPINALLVTSRDKSSLDTANPLVLKTGLLKGQGIAAFIEDYIQMGDKRVLFSNSEFYDDLGQFTSLVGDREITALLAALYSRHMIDHKENTSTERPNNVPELMDTYIDEMCRKAHDNSYPIEIVAPLAYKIAWNCLQDTLTPTETSLDQMLTALSNTEDTIELPAGQSNPNTVITFFVEKLRLLRRHGSNQRSLKFALDPLSEYLAARYLVTYSCRGDEHKWYNFLDVAEQRFASGEPIADFLRALKDTLDAKKQEGSVPEFVLQELCRRFPFVRAASNSDIRA